MRQAGLGAAPALILHCSISRHSTRRLTIGSSGEIFNRMIEYPTPLDGVFHALSDPTRRAMLATLSQGTRSVGELAAPFDISLAAASKHIRTLERSGLLKRAVQGRTHLCTLDAAPLAQVDAWLRDYATFWAGRLEALEVLLRDGAPDPGATDSHPTPTEDKTP